MLNGIISIFEDLYPTEHADHDLAHEDAAHAVLALVATAPCAGIDPHNTDDDAFCPECGGPCGALDATDLAIVAAAFHGADLADPSNSIATARIAAARIMELLDL